MGRRIGDFIIEEQIGAGGYGLVYRATQTTLARGVVVKLMRGRGDQNSARTQRFLREAQMAAQLDHPYAAHVYAFGAEDDGLLWIAMELVRGTTLKEMLAAYGSISLARFMPLLDKLCEVVHTAHQQGIVHRDIKPSNVMVLSRAGRLLPKLLDFGIARLLEVADGAEQDPWTGADIEELDENGSASPQHISVSEISASGFSISDMDVTRLDASIGSPPYMAPEQWISASRVDARSDLYALAVLTYESLTGHRPFGGPNMTAIAMAHASKPVPPLGEGFASGLDVVLRHALAKKSAERYRDVLQFAAAFRAAAGLDNELEPLPRLDVSVRELALARAPQPLADGVAVLEAARTPKRALQAIEQITHITVRWLGLVSMAALTRIGPGNDEAGEAALNALAELRRRRLSMLEWFDLVHTLVTPFFTRPDLYPIPEMVLLFSESESESESGPASFTSASTRALVERLLTASASVRDSESGDERLDAEKDDRNRVLTELLPRLARLLRRLAFLFRYPLIVHHGASNEAWMGVRRSERAGITVRGADKLRDGDVILATRDSEYLLTLSPLVQLMVPAPGSPRELFFFDGPSRFGAKLVALPIGFERHDNEFWPWYRRFLAEEIRDLDDDVQTRGRAPYLGLATFAPGDADNYFGREGEVDTFVNRLRIMPFLAVVGPSGAGKSSFVQAGIIPALGDDWIAVTVRPGPAPVSHLVAGLERAGIDVGDLRSRMETDQAALGEVMRQHATQEGRRVLLVIDQFEELRTLCPDSEQRALYSRALMVAARSAEDPVRVIATLRDDFLVRAQALPGLRDRLSHSLQIVSTPPPDELVRILIEPARRAGYDFDDEKLAQEMVEQVADAPGALALLSFTASKLWEARDRQQRQLTRAAYGELGGVGGALARHAEATLSAMPDERLGLVREVFRQVITAEGTRAILTRAELGQLLGHHEDAEKVLEALIHARLLVASEGEGGEDRIEVVHEALLGSWPRLVTWQREDAEGVRLRDQLRAAARQWEERGRPRGLLWRGDALLEYRVWRARYPGGVTRLEQAFARTSLRDEARGRWLRRAVVLGAFLALSVGFVVVYQQREVAEVARGQAVESAAEATQSMIDLYVEQGRQNLLAGDPMKAFAYLHEARRQGADRPDSHFMMRRVVERLAGQLLVLPGHDGFVSAVDVTVDGSLIATGGFDRQLLVWGGESGQRLHAFEKRDGVVTNVAFSPDGAYLATADTAGHVEVWRTDTYRLAWRKEYGERVNVAALTYSPDGSQIATGSSDRTIRVWSATSGEPVAEMTGHQHSVVALAWDPTGEYLVSGSRDRSARVWRVASGEAVKRVTEYLDAVNYIQVSPDGSTVVSASYRGEVRVFGLTDPQMRGWEGHAQPINGARFSPDGEHIVTSSYDGLARVWNAKTGELVFTIDGHEAGVRFAGYSPDGARLATASRDGTLRLWDARTGALLWTHIGHEDGIWTARFGATGERIITAGLDGSARVWDARKAGYRWTSHQPDKLHWTAADPGLSRVATLDHRGEVQVWTGDGEPLTSFHVGPGRGRLALRPDGARVLVVAGLGVVDSTRPRNTTSDTLVGIWDIASRTRVATLEGHEDRILCAEYSPDGRLIVTASVDRTARIWNAETGALVRVLKGHEKQIRHASFDGAGERLVTASGDRTARVWNVETGRLEVTLVGHTLQIASARFSADGRHIITAGDDKLARIWSAEDGAVIAILEGHANLLSDARLGAHSRFAFTASRDGTIKVWHVASRQIVWSIDETANMDIATPIQPESATLVAGAGRSVAMWQLSDRPVPDKTVQSVAECRAIQRLVDGRAERRTIDYPGCQARPESRGAVSD